MWSGESVQGMMLQEPEGVSTDTPPSLILSLFHPFVAERAPGSEHLKP